MTAAAFALTTVGVTLALGFIPAWVARSRQTLFPSDLALILLPPLLFYGTAVRFNSELEVGFGLFVYPFLTLVTCVATLYARVFLLDHWHTNPRINSLGCLIVASFLSVVVGAVIPPLAE